MRKLFEKYKLKKIILLLIGLLIFTNNYLYCVNYLWSNRIYSTGSDITNFSLHRTIIDKDDNIYACGIFQGSISIDGVNYKTTTGSTGVDVFVVKLDKNGQFIWLKTFGSSTGTETASGMTISSDGKCLYISLLYNVAITNLSGFPAGLSAGTGIDVALLKINTSTGDVYNAFKVISGIGNQFVTDFKYDNNKFILSGYYNNQLTFNTSSSTFSTGATSPTTYSAMYVAILDTNGVWENSKSYYASSATSNQVRGIDVSSSNIFISGTYKGSLTLGSLTPTLSNSNSFNASFLLCLDKNLNEQWYRKSSGSTFGDEIMYSVGSDYATNNVIIGGFFSSDTLKIQTDANNIKKIVNVNKSTRDLFFAKYSELGTMSWSYNTGSNYNDYMLRGSYKDNTFISCGTFNKNIVINEDTLTSKKWSDNSKYSSDVFGLVIQSNQNLVYFFNLGGDSLDNGYSATIDNKGKYIFSGLYTNSYGGKPIVIGSNSFPVSTPGYIDLIITKVDNKSIKSTKSHPKCPGAYNGSLSIQKEGTANIVSYKVTKTDTIPNKVWNFSQDSTLNNLGAGIYKIRITDDVSEYTEKIDTLTDQPALSLTYATPTAPTCLAASDGAIAYTSHTPSDRAIASYEWSTSNGSGIVPGVQSQIALAAGIYSLTATDVNGCSASLSNLVVPAGASIVINKDASTNETDLGTNDGTLDVSVTGIAAPTYTWTKAADGSAVVGTTNLTGLSSGQYNLSVSKSACSKDTSFTVNNSNTTVLVVSEKHYKISCIDGADGAIKVKPSGAGGSYTYSWTKDGNPIASTSDSIGNLSVGTYVCTVNGSASIRVVLSNPADIVLTPQTSNSTCFDSDNGSAAVSIANATAPYTYNWSNGSTTPVISSLAPGSYNVTVTDAKGCTKPYTGISITEPPQITATVTPTPITCNGMKNGMVEVTGVTNNQGAFTYSWNSGQTTAKIQYLPKGDYTVTITDSKGCNTQYTRTVVEPAKSISISSTDPDNKICTGESVTLTASGTNNFYWNTGETSTDKTTGTAGIYTVTGTDANGCVSSETDTVVVNSLPIVTASIAEISGSTANDGNMCVGDSLILSGVGASTYTWDHGVTNGVKFKSNTTQTYIVTGTDANGCQNTASKLVTVYTLPTLGIGISESSVTPDDGTVCKGSSVTLTGSGASIYSWSGGIGNGVSFAPIATSTYTLTATDGNGCINTKDQPITVNALPTINIVSSDADKKICANQSVTLTASGANTYSWNSGETNAEITKNTTARYIVTGTDANGCVGTANDSITVNPLPIVVISTNDADNAICLGQSVTLTASGASTFAWISGETEALISKNASGTYTVTGTDVNGCQNTASKIITLLYSDVISSAEVINSNCNGKSAGSINITTSGGTAPYRYEWSDGLVSEDRTSLQAGQYELSVFDVNNCKYTDTFKITEPAAIVIDEDQAQHQNITCYNNTDGRFALKVVGGSGKYKFTLDSAKTWGSDSIYSMLKDGYYKPWVSDFNNQNCVVKYSGYISITAPEPLTVQVADKQNALCFGVANAYIKLKAQGGNGIYQYSINNGTSFQSASSFFNLSKGTLSILAKDLNNCMSESIADSITEPSKLVKTLVSATNPTKKLVSDGAISVKAEGGTPPYTYVLNSVATNSTGQFVMLGAGIQKITLLDANQCQDTISKLLQEPIDTLTLIANAERIVTRLYPNPSEGKFYVDLSIPQKQNISIEIFNILGKKEFSLELNQMQSIEKYLIDLRGKPTGVYILKVNGMVYKKRLVIQ